MYSAELLGQLAKHTNTSIKFYKLLYQMYQLEDLSIKAGSLVWKNKLYRLFKERSVKYQVFQY